MFGNRHNGLPLRRVQPRATLNSERIKRSIVVIGASAGGVTALAARKTYPVYADETMQRFDAISVSSGVRGAQIILAPADYVRATNATVGVIAKARLAPQ